MRRVIWGVTVGPVIQEKGVKWTTVATTVRMEEHVYHHLWVNISALLYSQITCIFLEHEKYKENNINISSGILIKKALTLITFN